MARVDARLCVFISIHGHRHAHLFLSVLFFLVSLYFVLKSFFHLLLNPAMVPDENSMEDPLCHSAIGSMVSLDYVTHLTGYEPKDMELADTNERNLAASSDIYFQDILEDTVSFSSSPSFLQSWSIERGNPLRKGAIAIIFLVSVRNVKSAQNQFPLVTQSKRMIDRTGGTC